MDAVPNVLRWFPDGIIGRGGGTILLVIFLKVAPEEYQVVIRETAKKSSFLSGTATKGVKAVPLRKKELFGVNVKTPTVTFAIVIHALKNAFLKIHSNFCRHGQISRN